MHHKERHIMKLLYGVDGEPPTITNTKHRKIADTYNAIRIDIDKVNMNTRDSDLIAIRYLSMFLKNKPFDKATRDDIREWSKWLKTERNLSESSVNDYQMKIKHFYKYIVDPDKYQNGRADQKDIRCPDSVRWITYDDNSSELPLESILNEKEIMKLLNACKDARDQAIICSFLDTGIRKSELLNLKVRNVDFDKKLGAYIILPKKKRKKGLKTGMRKIQFFLIPSSTAYIREYLNHHRYKDDPDAPFIYTFDAKVKGSKPNDFMITEIGISEIVNRIVKRADIKKHLTPHILRHNSVTMCCKKGFNEPMLRERYGWSARSKMPSRYVHLANVDMDNKIKQILGIKDEEQPEESMLQPIICWNCGYENPCSHIYCGKCSASLKPKKEEITGLKASDLGVAIQKGMNEEQVEEITRNVLINLLKEYDLKKK